MTVPLRPRGCPPHSPDRLLLPIRHGSESGRCVSCWNHPLRHHHDCVPLPQPLLLRNTMHPWNDPNLTEQQYRRVSLHLARAIGWKQVLVLQDGVRVRDASNKALNGWKLFDFRDPGVIWPIAEKMKCFPSFVGTSWVATLGEGKDKITEVSDSAALSVARVVIGAYEARLERNQPW